MNYERARSGSGYFLVEKEYFEEFSWLISRYKWKKFKTYKLINFSPQLN